jgi:hypothetical protein
MNNIGKLDRKIVITSAIPIADEKSLQKIDSEVFHTEDTNILNALFLYLKNHATIESNCCCCP